MVSPSAKIYKQISSFILNKNLISSVLKGVAEYKFCIFHN